MFILPTLLKVYPNMPGTRKRGRYVARNQMVCGCPPGNCKGHGPRQWGVLLKHGDVVLLRGVSPLD